MRTIAAHIRLPRRGTAVPEPQSRFGLRLLVAAAATMLALLAGGSFLIGRQLTTMRIDRLASIQRADAASFEALSADPAAATGDISRLLNAIARRPGTREALLVDQRHVIVSAGRAAAVGHTIGDPRIDAALATGTAYAGKEARPNRDPGDFEFVMPVNLAGARYAYEVTYSHAPYDAEVAAMRRVLIAIGALAFVFGIGLFYLCGGRSLMRTHRDALARATSDPLTGLPNQRAFDSELVQSVNAAERYGTPLGLAVVDVDEFKLINDRHGHPHGDAVLMRLAEVLSTFRSADRPYRVGGDEFALLMPNTDAGGVGIVARRLLRSFEAAGVRVTIGVSTLRQGAPVDTLRAEADAAMYEAKRDGGNRVVRFDDIRDHVSVTTSDKRQALRRLLDDRGVSIVYQPIWAFDGNALVGIEAFARPHEVYGLGGPANAFDIAEQLGQVHALDVLCVTEAIRSAPPLPDGALLFINLSPQTLDLDAESNDWLLKITEEAGMRPSAVVVEVTERFGGRLPSVVKCVNRLRTQGFKIAIDDVGTGNSGLEMLRQVHAEFVKIDRSVVTTAASEPSARALLFAMAAFAQQTGSFVIAEGIEDMEELEFLRSIHERELRAGPVIQGGQGYCLGLPATGIDPSPPAALLRPTLRVA
jgi:diguanylate cyclase (GGDEF)-like protein